jgi:hypothetical protein
MKEELHGVISNLHEGHGLGPMAVWKSGIQRIQNSMG